MAASRNDSYQLSQDPGFQHRVQASLLAACVAISNEGWTVVFHRERASFAQQILSNAQNTYVVLFSNTVATDPNVLADATQGGTVSLGSSTVNVATQAQLITDAHIDSAIAGQFNSFNILH